MLDRDEIYVICPFFKWDSQKIIRCEGHSAVEDSTECRALAFASEKAKRQYAREVCATFGYADRCPYADFMNKYYEEKLKAENH